MDDDYRAVDDDKKPVDRRVLELIGYNDELIATIASNYIMNANYDAVIDLFASIRNAEYGESVKAYASHKHGKKYFDPRHWNHAGRESMSKHVIQVAELLGSKDMA